MLASHAIALADVLEKCDIDGSSDSYVKNVVADYRMPILVNADIRQKLANGKCAEEYKS